MAYALHRAIIMDELDRAGDGRWSPHRPWGLGPLAETLIRAFWRIAQRLKYPALASVPVSAAMLSRVDTVSAEEPLADVARMFVGGRVRQLPVVERGHVVGVITRDAVARALGEAGPEASVRTAPSHTVVIVAPTDALGDVLARLRSIPRSIALVVDRGTPVGLLTEDELTAYVQRGRAA